jgi:hypothetical protein
MTSNEASFLHMYLSYRMFHLKRNPNCNSTCKLGDSNIRKQASCFWVLLLERTYRTALQQVLKMSTTFLKTSIHIFSYSSRSSVSEEHLKDRSMSVCLSRFP